MTIARKYIIDHSQTCFYHCMSRCVEQRFLLKQSADGNESRSEWIESKLLSLANAFAIDVLSYAIMGNHTHCVLYANHSLLDSWSNAEVLKRRLMLGKIPDVCHLFLNEQTRTELSEIEITLVLELIAKYRKELTNISGFMQRLNSYIARRANKEDGRKGHFWEGRFKSQALLNEDAILPCMAYVDLNPLRVGICKSLIQSNHTSIKQRLLASQKMAFTKLLPFRRDCDVAHLASVCQLSLASYVDIITRLLENEGIDDLLLEFSMFTKDSSNWKALALDFEDNVGIASGDEALVRQFEKKARESSYLSELQLTKIAASVLFELRDIQYHPDKNTLPNGSC
jgi:putative transposase